MPDSDERRRMRERLMKPGAGLRHKTGKTTRLGPRIRTHAGQQIDGAVSVTWSVQPRAPRLHVEPWQDPYGQPKPLGELWYLVKRDHVARCILQGHPIGTEAVIFLDDEWHRSEAFRDQKPMIDATTAWRDAFVAKGWTAALEP